MWIHTVHVIYKNETLEGGNIPDQQVADSIQVLNQDFASTGLSFNLLKTTRTLNEAWFENFAPKSWVLPIFVFDPSSPTHRLGLRRLKPSLLCVKGVQKP